MCEEDTAINKPVLRYVAGPSMVAWGLASGLTAIALRRCREVSPLTVGSQPLA